MATLLLSVGGQALGAALGGPVGATIGRALGAQAGSAIDNQLFGEDAPAPNGAVRLLGSREGTAISRLYGWSRLSGNIIWATELERRTAASSGAKSASNQQDDETYVVNLAVGFCEGEVAHLGRMWADGQLLDTRNLTYRFHKGSADQMPDSLIAAMQGADNCPAYRGLCYIVFENLDIGQFGNRIPQISVELCRPVGDLEQNLRAVCVIPGSTEFGYDPSPRVRLLGYGETKTENAHQQVGKSDWDVSINELSALCPNLKHVALVISWFGDDLRCGECKVAPRVVDHGRNLKDVNWEVTGLDRQSANVVSLSNDGPAYGGTPSDQSIIDAIHDLHSRGIKVTLYPLMMMDIPADNELPDPYGNIYQPPYPWRGRVTVNPTIGRPSSADQTAAAASQISQFMGLCQPADFTVSNGVPLYNGPSEWRYRRYVLQYANLARAAGGVDAMMIGAEMPGLSFVRDGSKSFPFVQALKQLAGDVRQIVGVSCKITYGADWSEYHGYQPADEPGGKYFHLDPLWADPNIDAVGIDNYMPLTDWREHSDHPDGQVSRHEKDLNYLAKNIYGGEGYDWYYASPQDRAAQIRTPITDGVASQDWVWRYKDVKSWWSNPHHNRPNGVIDGTATPWVPESKPIWFTELGCGAVHFGGNQPNAFPDPKSVENKQPYFSEGTTDSAMQRQCLRAHLSRWQNGDEVHNPMSGQYGGPMLDAERIYFWAWDARPYPAFPILTHEWSDGDAYFTGHWLNGRLGGATIDEMAKAITAEAGIDIDVDVTSQLLIEGQLTSANASPREELAGLLTCENYYIDDRAGRLTLTAPRSHQPAQIEAEKLVANKDRAIEITFGDDEDSVRRLDLTFLDHLADYGAATAFYDQNKSEGGRAYLNWPTTLDPSAAANIAKAQWQNGQNAKAKYQFELPPSLAAYSIGDVIEIAGKTDKATVDTTQLAHSQRITTSLPRSAGSKGQAAPVARRGRTPEPSQSAPLIILAQMPNENADELNTKLFAAAYAKPWPGSVRLTDMQGQNVAEIEKPNPIGIVQEDFAPATHFDLWDHAQSLLVRMLEGHLSSATPLAVMQGVNRLWVEKTDGSWEQIGFATAELVAPKTYRLSRLLRGLGKTQFAAQQPSVAGARVLVHSEGKALSVPSEKVRTELGLYAYAGAASAEPIEVAITPSANPLLPLAPVHLRAMRVAGSNDIQISWVRCTRAGGDMWQGQDVPMDTESLSFELRIGQDETTLRTTQITQPTFTYSAATQTADFGGLVHSAWIEVSQISAIWGAGHPKRINFSD
ncbi:baseplate multidomain protein megatron [Maritalea mediterranea]|uniref:Glycoside hydrolase/phage tail family protein n=1 Tax=Maritalea mediterranea TaxID=2909667 RepID=A0ABS9E6V8_9HYPH|nr:glycoside hydrolase TIM-barrel-like domain-containing protein [Maritalea mediterranea]MCF4097944.1 glycoside hydrolase/phage tail family protein [Maritalea mediterranea]